MMEGPRFGLHIAPQKSLALLGVSQDSQKLRKSLTSTGAHQNQSVAGDDFLHNRLPRRHPKHVGDSLDAIPNRVGKT